MGLLSRIASWGRTTTPAMAPMGPPSPQASFIHGTDGHSQRLAWKGYAPQYNLASPYSSGAYGIASRDRHLSTAIATDFSTTNPTIATLIENLSTHCVGTGLTLSSKIDGDAIGVSADEARALSSRIETEWARWAGNAVECDRSGRFTVHDIAFSAFRSYLMTGEVVCVLDWMKTRGATTRTKINLLDSRQLDAMKSLPSTEGVSVLQGVAFDQVGRVAGYYLIPSYIGQPYTTNMSKFVAARTSWGRVRVLHLADASFPGQVRGLSPLTPALTAAQEKATLEEVTLTAALVQSQFAVTLESDLPPQAAFNGLRNGDGYDGGPLPSNFDPIASRIDWYTNQKLDLRPGTINHLSLGDKLKMNRAETPNGNYEAFDRALMRSAAKAAGSSGEDVSGDYSQTSFSASRLAGETPARINLRRRAAIPAKLYQAIFTAWLEEAIESGTITLPRNALPFYAATSAYTQSSWLGSGRITADPLKSAQATELELSLGLTTLSAALAERGLDFESVVLERKAELDALREAGLPTSSGTKTTSVPNDQTEAAEDGQRAPSRKVMS